MSLKELEKGIQFSLGPEGPLVRPRPVRRPRRDSRHGTFIHVPVESQDKCT